ncbi:MAG: MBL fold metallo-hydrolase [Bacteroidota bacterium]
MYLLLSIIVLFVVAVYVFMQQAQFGKKPSGERLVRMQNSPHYRDGAFQNMSITPSLTEGASYYSVLKEFLFTKKERKKPIEALPSVKTDLLNLNPSEDVLVWFGHSSYFMQVDGKKILVDPVFSGSASPLPNGTKAFKGADIYTTDDMPEIDHLFISHDHWDHLDYTTIKKLLPKVKNVVCGLGVGAHLEHWGYDANIIVEMDWHEEVILNDGFRVKAYTGRHFSGRGFKRNGTLWCSYLLQTPTMKIFIGGDSGYDSHFAEIGKQHGPIDIAILENGQYDKAWRYIHMLPEEILQAAKELNAQRIFPVHSSKFSLSNHAWDEPLKKITENNKKEQLAVITPMIGEAVRLKDSTQQFSNWWEGVQ